MSSTVYFKAAVNENGELHSIGSDLQGKATLSECAFTYAEAENLEAMGCRPVVVSVVRAFKTRQDVVEDC